MQNETAEDSFSSPRLHQRLLRVTTTLGILLSIVACLLVWRFTVDRRSAEETSRNTGRELAAEVAKRIESFSAEMKSTAESLALDYSNGEVSSESLITRMQECLELDLVKGVGIAYRPFTHSEEQELYAPFLIKGEEEVGSLTDLYHYADFDQAIAANWYHSALLKGDGIWTSGSGLLEGAHVAFSLPFHDAKKNPLGVIVLAVTKADLTYLINSGFVGRFGAGFLIDERGELIAFPQSPVVETRTKLTEIAVTGENDSLLQLAEADSEPGRLPGTDPLSQGQATYFHRTLPTTNWRIVVSALDEEITPNGKVLRREKMLLAIIGAALLTALALCIACWNRISARRLAIVATIYSALVLAAVFFAGSLTLGKTLSERLSNGLSENSSRRFVSGQASINAYVEDQTGGTTATGTSSGEEADSDQPDVVPTGVSIDSIDFESPNNVKVSGMIWHRAPLSEAKDDLGDFIFPDASPDVEGMLIEPTIKVVDGDSLVYQRRFKVTLRLNLEFASYPFDYHLIPIRVRMADPVDNTLLVPDLDAYDLTHTRSRPGVAPELVLPGWTVDGSYFTFEQMQSNTDFGIRTDGDRAKPFDFQYNVLIRREIITPFLSHIFPLLVVAALLFGVLISAGDSEESAVVSGFSAFGVLETCGAFFFAIIFVHIDMRSSLSTDTITYLESLHLIMYIILLLVAIDALLFSATDLVDWIEYQDNVIAKIIYWPVVFTLALISTMYFFY